MPDVNVVEELQSLLELEVKPDEGAQAFAERLARKADSLKDDDWATLSEATQRWVNSAIDAISGHTDIDLPSGIDTIEGLAEEEEGSTVDNEGVDMSKRPAKKSGGKKLLKQIKKAAKKFVAASGNGTQATAKRGPKHKLSPSARITVLAKTNPHRPGSADFDRFNLYKSKMTVEEALKAGVRSRDINWHAAKGCIRVS